MSVRHYGSGPRAALALHCSLAHAGEWSALGTALDDLLTITAFDLPGHGNAPDWDPRGPDVAEATLALARPVLPAGQVDLIGHSFGGVAALLLALERPDRVRSLTLIEPTLFAAARAGAPEVAAAHIEAHRPFDAALERGEVEHAARLFTEIWGVGIDWDLLPDRQRQYLSARIHLIRAALPVLWDDTHGLLAPGRLEGFAPQVLILEGGASPPVIGAIADELSRRLPAAERATVPGARHMLPITHGPEVAGALRAFLSRG